VTLNHANICNVFDVGRVATRDPDDPSDVVEEYYLAMEYLSGRDLRVLLERCRKQGRPVDVTTAVHLVCEVLKALDYAHRRRHPVTGEPLHLVHRDVSPQNVLVSYEGEVKLIDFGLAASRLKVERTQPNVVMGKMAYMPPEQARGDPIDARADLFASGVLLYELVTNERYYEGMTAADIWQVAGRGGFVPRAWGSIDPFLQVILGRALHPDPTRRIGDCGELREELLGFLSTRNGAGAERALRLLMESMFADDIARERATMARFGNVTIAAFRIEQHEATSTTSTTTFASSKSAAAAPADDATVYDATRPPATDEATTLSPPPSSSPSSSSASSSASSGGTLHDAPTRLQQRPDHAVVDETTDGRIHDERTVLTQPVPRAPGHVGHGHDDDDLGDITAMQLGIDRRPLWAGIAIVVLLLLVLVGVAGRDPEPSTVATTSPSPSASPSPSPSSSATPAPVIAAPAEPAPLHEPAAVTPPVVAAPAVAPAPAAPSPSSPSSSPSSSSSSSTTKPPRDRPAKAAATTSDGLHAVAIPTPAPTPTPTPTPAVVTPTPRPPAAPVSSSAWGNLLATRSGDACVRALAVTRFKLQEPEFLRDYSPAIRACASQIGAQL
ncbi:MAG TPA: serine/threonine-protein kinase, partial [Myxococcota bacterium]